MATKSKQVRRKAVIAVLNKARAMELQAVHQYMNQHYGLDDMDYGELAANLKLIAIDEMRHAEQFAERIKELGLEGFMGPVKTSCENHEGGRIVIFQQWDGEKWVKIDEIEPMFDFVRQRKRRSGFRASRMRG